MIFLMDFYSIFYEFPLNMSVKSAKGTIFYEFWYDFLFLRRVCLFPAGLPEFPGRHAGIFFENITKIMRIAESGLAGDIRAFHGGVP
jgi:hypothetical protein